MKIVRFKGGLGNQLFQYGVFLSLKEVFKEGVFVDLFFYDYYKDARPFVLQDAFAINLSDCYADRATIASLSSNNYSFFQRLYYKFFNVKFSHIIDKEKGYDNSIYNNKPMYLDGYWQSHKYSQRIKSELIKSLQFNYDKNDVYFNSIRDQIINNKETVSIHVRLGDYINNSVYVDLINTDYYKNVLNEIKTEKKTVYVFSDEIDSVKQIELFSDFVFVDSSKFPTHYDMYLMSICKTNVIANSSYSYWAAYLNNNNDKKIFCPSNWFNNRITNISDMYPEEWVVVDV